MNGIMGWKSPEKNKRKKLANKWQRSAREVQKLGGGLPAWLWI